MAESGALRSILAYFGIDVDASQLDGADKKIKGFTANLKLAGAAIGEGLFFQQAKAFFSEQVQNAAHLQDLAERFDVTVQSIKAFGFAAESAGIDMDSATRSLSILQRNLGKAGIGGKGGEQAKAFHDLGIHIKDAAGNTRPFNDILLDVADAMQKLPDQSKRSAYAMELFGRQGMLLLPILSQGRKHLEGLFKEANELGSGLGSKFYNDAKEAREEFQHFGFALNSIKERILDAVLPTIIMLGGWLIEISQAVLDLTKHTNLLKEAMLGIALFAGWKTIGTIVSLIEKFGLLDKVMLLLRPTIIETALAFALWALPAVAILSLFLLLEDFWTMLKGGKSVIGDDIDALFGFGASRKFVDWLTEGVSKLTDDFEGFGLVVWGLIAGPLKALWETFKGIGAVIGDLVTGNLSAIAGDVESSVGAIGDAVSQAIDQMKRGGALLDHEGPEVHHFVMGGGTAATKTRQAQTISVGREGKVLTRQPRSVTIEHATLPHGAGGGRSGGGDHHVTQHNNVTVTVDTKSENPRRVLNATADGVTKGMKNSAEQANTLAAGSVP
jgi:TP901 family phage tail tape measure protein